MDPMQSRLFRYAKIAVSGAWIMAVLAILADREVYQSTLVSGFFCLALLAATVIHLRVYPRLREALWVTLLAAVFAILDFGLLRFRFIPVALVSFLGCASLLLMGVKAVWSAPGRRRLVFSAFIAALLFVSSDWMASTFLDWTEVLHPKTLDLYLLYFDGSLGFQPSFALAELFQRWRWLWWVSISFYIGLPMSIAIVYANQLLRRAAYAAPMIFAFVITGPLGVLFYNIFPATGPIHILRADFPFHPLSFFDLSHLLLEPISVHAPRNAIPSLHMAWVLLVWWWSRGLSWWIKGISLAFLVFTIFATLGTGEHYLVDLVVALPFAVMIQGTSTLLWRSSLRDQVTPIVAGALGTFGWLALLRFAPRFCWMSQALPWLLILLTVIVFLPIERRYCRYPEGAVLNEDADLRLISATAD